MYKVQIFLLIAWASKLCEEPKGAQQDSLFKTSFDYGMSIPKSFFPTSLLLPELMIIQGNT